MKPIGPLMREHRLIERMIALLNRQIQDITIDHSLNADFLSLAIDFFRTYADRTHHGKEEDILFRELAKKQLTVNHQKIMKELIEDHNYARKTIKALFEAKEIYFHNRAQELGNISKLIMELVTLYPIHIAKEDREFFYPCLQYLSQKEQDDMLQEFWEFDRKLIHEKYLSIVDEAEVKIIRSSKN